MASVTMTVLPAATLPASGVTEIVFPDVSLPFVPRFLTRQTVPGVETSAGQLALDPEQNSAGSQTPVEVRHSVVEGLKASVGQVVLEPVQVSATSQSPATARHTAPAFP